MLCYGNEGHRRPSARLLSSAAALMLSAALALGQPAATFQTIPALPGGTPSSVAYAATPDGAYVVGFCGSPHTNWPADTSAPQAYRWNRLTGELTGLGFLGTADHYRSKAYAISDDGTVVVGGSDVGDHSSFFAHAFRWTPAAGMVSMAFAPTQHQLGPIANAVTAMSADGSVIVGRLTSYGVHPNHVDEWCRWDAAGQSTFLPNNTSPVPGRASVVSADGTIVAGFVSEGFTTDAFHAGALFGTQLVALGVLPGGQGRGEATAISRDDTTIVGWADARDSDNVVRYHLFRWRSATGMVDLGRAADLPGHARASAVNADGSVLVGTQGGRAIIHDDAHGVRDLGSVLTSQYGLDLAGKILTEANWISPDGHWIVGNAQDPVGPMATEGWIAHLP
jgi:probable HAF family extracellular repeat protein